MIICLTFVFVFASRNTLPKVGESEKVAEGLLRPGVDEGVRDAGEQPLPSLYQGDLIHRCHV